MDADSIKLIAYGKVLENDYLRLMDYNIKEGDFLVTMVGKKAPMSLEDQNRMK